MKQSAINHISNMRLVIIRQDYIELFKMIETDDDKCPDYACTSAILNVFEYWTNYKIANREQAQKHNEILESGGKEPVYDDSLWIYKTIDEIKTDELLDTWGRNKTSNCLKWLEQFNIIETRNNPDYAWDQALQYQLNIHQLNDYILELNNAMFKIKQSSVQNQTIDSLELNNIHYTEITTEIDMNRDIASNDDSDDFNSTRIESTIENTEQSKIDTPQSKRKRNESFDWIALNVFSIQPENITKTNSGRIGKCLAAINEVHETQGTQLTVPHLDLFKTWYEDNYKDQTMPKSHIKLCEYYTEYYQYAKSLKTAKTDTQGNYVTNDYLDVLDSEDI